MKEKCWRGPVHPTEMDVKLAWAAALLAGRRVTNAYNCDVCGGWHLGFPKNLVRDCRHTGKRSFTKDEAQEELRICMEKRALGYERRQEQRIYECPPPGCGGWHLTSLEIG